MLVQACFLLSLVQHYLCVDLTYYVDEEKSPNTYVGDIAADTNLMDTISPQDYNLITFSQLQHGVSGGSGGITSSSGSQLFHISKTGKLYTAQALDAESLCTRHMECIKMVEVAVKRANSFMRVLEIKVIIKDINDHQPSFPVKQVNISFSEGDWKGMRKSLPSAIDKDVGVDNSQITYQLRKNINEPFTLSISQNADGTSELGINLEERLDREAKEAYIIQVVAKDGGSPPKQIILDVYITVTDINDNTPVFSKKVYNVSIENEVSDMSPVAILFARDLDSGHKGKVSYHFSSQTSDIVKTHFKLNEITGEIFLRRKFTAGQKLTYKLYVKATDGGSPPLSAFAKVLVHVINQQNNAPVIDVNFVSASTENTATISEDMEVGSFIAYVKITDHDAGQNGEVNCDLHHDKFQLQSLGTKKYKITIKNTVDREIEDHHDITISCQDKGSPPLHAETKFSIKVIDINDVRPQFAKETYKFRIKENQDSKIHVGTINATDSDLGPGGKLTYSLLTNNKQFLPFQISDSGLITTIVSLDHEFQDIYKFKVLVKDRGRPPLNNTVNVVVEVRDENDNAPYFTYPSVNPFTLDLVYYPHHTKNITVLKASDSDSRENAFLKYEITSGNDKQLFTVNHYSGLLSFTRMLNQQDSGSYDLGFIAKDSGTPVLSATTSIFLTLTVSNKTSEMQNTVYIQTNDKINLNLAIVIVLIAVTASVIITASLSISIIRCNDWTNGQHKDDVHHANHRYISEQRHLMCPSNHANSLPNVPVIRTNSDKTGTSTHSGIKNEEEFGNKKRGSSLPLEPSTSNELSHKMWVQEVAIQKNKCMNMEDQIWKSKMCSHVDNGQSWIETGSGPCEKVLGM